MNILSMLVRLQSTLGRSDLVNQMVLLPKAHSLTPNSKQEINLAVGYSGSPCSQTALDLTLWIAHQTRLATGKQVTVQVVYVVENKTTKIPVYCPTESIREVENWVDLRQRSSPTLPQGSHRKVDRPGSQTAVVELPEVAEVCAPSQQMGMADVFERADRILWQARCLADEWRGSLKTHLRFGTVAQELKSVVEEESASLLILGCETATHPLVQQLGKNFPCPVLGIPSALENDLVSSNL
ncbi:universal stress protein [Phormidesmis priestleyi]